MAKTHAHQKLLNQAAREALKPLGVRQQGRSRVWWDDNGWWLGVVYFKPSGYARESNLELHIRWLWKMQSRHSLGDSVSSTISIGSDAWYAVYENDEQFALLIKQQAALAADHVARLREVLSTPDAAAAATERWHLRVGPRKEPSPMEKEAMAAYEEQAKSQPPSDGELDHAVLLGLAGRLDEAAAIFDRYLTLLDPNEAPNFETSRDWHQEWLAARRRNYDWIRNLRHLSNEPALFAEEIRNTITAARARLGLATDTPLAF